MPRKFLTRARMLFFLNPYGCLNRIEEKTNGTLILENRPGVRVSFNPSRYQT